MRLTAKGFLVKHDGQNWLNYRLIPKGTGLPIDCLVHSMIHATGAHVMLDLLTSLDLQLVETCRIWIFAILRKRRHHGHLNVCKLMSTGLS